METPYIILAFNVVLSVAAFFGGIVIKGLLASVKSLQEADTKFMERLENYAKVDELREFRTEYREDIRQLFKKIDSVGNSVTTSVEAVRQKIDGMQLEIAKKADRNEVMR